MALPHEASTIYNTFKAVADSHVNVVGRMQAVEPASHRVVHATLTRLANQFWMMYQVHEARSKEVWHHGL